MDHMTLTSAVATRIQVHAIDAPAASQLRERDDAGHRPRLLTDVEGGSPLRCCLRRSRPGEQVALVSFAPLRRWARRTGADPGPYDELGPVFIHPSPCDGPARDGFPADYLGARWLLRAYRADGTILRGQLAEGADVAGAAAAEKVLARLLSDPDVAIAHVRAVEFGCFQFEVSRG
jgi:hypothetical protein